MCFKTLLQVIVNTHADSAIAFGVVMVCPMIVLPSRRMAHSCHCFAIAQVNTTRQVFIERLWSLHRDRDFGPFFK